MTWNQIIEIQFQSVEVVRNEFFDEAEGKQDGMDELSEDSPLYDIQQNGGTAILEIEFLQDREERIRPGMSWRIQGDVTVIQTGNKFQVCSDRSRIRFLPHRSFGVSSILFEYEIFILTEGNPNAQNLMMMFSTARATSKWTLAKSLAQTSLPSQSQELRDYVHAEQARQEYNSTHRLMFWVEAPHALWARQGNVWWHPPINKDRDHILPLVGTYKVVSRPLMMLTIDGVRHSRQSMTSMLMVWLWLLFFLLEYHFKRFFRTVYWMAMAPSSLPDAYDSARSVYWNWNRRHLTPVRRGGYVRVGTIDTIVRMIQQAREHGWSVKAVGSGHHFGDMLNSPASSKLPDNISNGSHLDGHDKPMIVDPTNRGVVVLDMTTLNRVLDYGEGWVRVQGGIKVAHLVQWLESRGFGLCNHGDYMEQTLAGALATGTHGTDREGYPSLLGSVLRMRMVNGKAKIVDLEPEQYIHLGQAGVVFEVVLRTSKLRLYKRKRHLAWMFGTQSKWTKDTQALHSMLNKYDGVSVSTFGLRSLPLVRIVETATREAMDAVMSGQWSIWWRYPWNAAMLLVERVMVKSIGMIPMDPHSVVHRFTLFVLYSLYWMTGSVTDVWSYIFIHPYAPPLVDMTEWAVQAHHLPDVINALHEEFFRSQMESVHVHVHWRFQSLARDRSHQPWMQAGQAGGGEKKEEEVRYQRMNVRDPTHVPIVWLNWNILLTNGGDAPGQPEALLLTEIVERTMTQFKAAPHFGKTFNSDKEYIHEAYPKTKKFLKWIDKQDPMHLFANRWSARRLGRSFDKVNLRGR